LSGVRAIGIEALKSTCAGDTWQTGNAVIVKSLTSCHNTVTIAGFFVVHGPGHLRHDFIDRLGGVIEPRIVTNRPQLSIALERISVQNSLSQQPMPRDTPQ
jgi:hypothetical protein